MKKKAEEQRVNKLQKNQSSTKKKEGSDSLTLPRLATQSPRPQKHDNTPLQQRLR
jgi:hypothetical protein